MPAYTNVTLTCDAPNCTSTIDVRCELVSLPEGVRTFDEHRQMIVEVRPPDGWWHGSRAGYGQGYAPVCACPDHVSKVRGW